MSETRAIVTLQGDPAKRRKGGPGRKPRSTTLQPSSKLITYGSWWWTLPALVAVFAVHYVATLMGAAYAFTDFSGIGSFNWIGLDNFQRIPVDPQVTASIGNTFFIGIAYLVLTNLAGLGMALALNRTLKTRYILRTLLFLPVVLSSLAVSYIFRFIFDVNGPLNQILAAVGFKGGATVWLADPKYAIWTIITVLVWQQTGVPMVIFLAGLAVVPAELDEAAAIDGAGVFTRFWNITLPLLQPAIAISTTLSLIQGLRVFDQVIAMTNGGPFGATETLSTVIYKKIFTFSSFGYGAAISLIFTLIIIAAAGIQLFATRDRSNKG
ncbi:MAG: Lactose transport system permease protein LacF [Actinomycetota bacterium]